MLLFHVNLVLFFDSKIGYKIKQICSWPNINPAVFASFRTIYSSVVSMSSKFRPISHALCRFLRVFFKQFVIISLKFVLHFTRKKMVLFVVVGLANKLRCLLSLIVYFWTRKNSQMKSIISNDMLSGFCFFLHLHTIGHSILKTTYFVWDYAVFWMHSVQAAKPQHQWWYLRRRKWWKRDKENKNRSISYSFLFIMNWNWKTCYSLITVTNEVHNRLHCHSNWKLSILCVSWSVHISFFFSFFFILFSHILYSKFIIRCRVPKQLWVHNEWEEKKPLHLLGCTFRHHSHRHYVSVSIEWRISRYKGKQSIFGLISIHFFHFSRFFDHSHFVLFNLRNVRGQSPEHTNPIR